jgi:hypothetical protein
MIFKKRRNPSDPSSDPWTGPVLYFTVLSLAIGASLVMIYQMVKRGIPITPL